MGQVHIARSATLGDVCAQVHLGLECSAGIQHVTNFKQGCSVTRMPVAYVTHNSTTSLSGCLPVTDATQIRGLNWPRRREVARQVVIGPLCQYFTKIVLDLERVRPGHPDKVISRPGVMFTEN